MQLRSSLGFILVLAAVLGGTAAGLAWQGKETTILRAQLASLRTEASELSGLREENGRLREKQISSAELERLRADHAALPRLRTEIEALKRRP